MSIAYFVMRIFEFYEILVLIWCILSWLPISNSSFLGDFAAVIDRLVRPYVGLFQRFIPPLGGIDFSPIVALVVLNFIERLVVGIL
ncbi:MAG: YggT family protein [Atopobiaceae bacterium]